jgi:Fe-S cluster assembly iron-binding protein IscA
MGTRKHQTLERRRSVLTLTTDATDAIERILTAPGVPDGAGLRIAPAAATDTAVPASYLQIAVTVEPDLGDQVIEEAGARVFVEDTVAPYLEDKLLDAEVVDEQVQFTLGEES